MNDLFEFAQAPIPAPVPVIPEDEAEKTVALGQYPTPLWLAEAIVERYFPDLDSSDTVIEPTCGPGRFLKALPDQVKAVGVELDPALAAVARRITGRTIIEGDFCTVDLDVAPTAIIGNPPFQLSLVERVLQRAYDLLPSGGRLGFLLPCYMFQTAANVVEFNQRWSIRQEMLPRNVYPGLSKPLMFAMFSKDHKRLLQGFAFYHETVETKALDGAYGDLLNDAPTRPWKAVVATALQHLGGQATLEQLYREIEGRRPTATNWWKEKVRQQCQRYFRHVGPGTYALPQAA